MPLRGTTTDERPNYSPREGQGPSDPGVGCGIGNEPTPALRATPPRRGLSKST